MLLYMKLIWCSGFSEIYAQLEEGVGSICHGYMCIVLHMKLIWFHGFPEIYAQLEELHRRSFRITYERPNKNKIWQNSMQNQTD